MPDVLFDQLAQWQGGGWGRMLDAGTGAHSMQWAMRQRSESITAVTADAQMAASVRAELGQLARPSDRLLVGNWMDDAFCASLGTFDTVLADYLIGSVDGFSPFAQDLILERLRDRLADKGSLYLIGMHPIPDVSAYPGRVISEVRRARDSAILLAGHRPYREFPLDWMERHLASAGLRVVERKTFTIMHSEASVLRQLKVAQSKLHLMDPLARQGMEPYFAQLEMRVRTTLAGCQGGRIPLSYDYVIKAEHDPSFGMI